MPTPTATATRRRMRSVIVSTPSKSKKSTAAIEVLEPATASAITEEAANVPLFNPFDESIPFFMATAMIQEEEWHRYLIYLYRLLPRVRNPEGERNFICKYARAVDEADIKGDHGGGKYQIYLTEKPEEISKQPGAAAGDVKPRSRNFVFSIAGAPRLQPGQATTSDAGNAPLSDEVQPGPGVALAPRPTGTSDVAVLASVLKDLIENRQNGDDGGSQAMELAGQAYKTGLTIVSEAARQTVQTSTGSALGDKLLERLLDGKFGGRNGDSDLRDKLALIAIERLQNPPAAEAKDPLGQLSFVKDLLGVESITDLIRPGGNDAWKSKLVELGANLVGNLPQLFQLFITSQQQQFQRQLQMEALRRQGPTLALGNNNTPLPSPRIQFETAAHPPAPGPIPVPAAGEETVRPVFNPAQMALDEIVVDFGEGLDGQMTARLVRQRYAIIIEQMKPMLGDLAQVKLFAQNTPPLSEIAGDPEFPQFLAEFVNEILHPAADEPEDETAGNEGKEGALLNSKNSAPFKEC